MQALCWVACPVLQEPIERITIDHEHKKKIVAADGQVVTWNPTNHIVIDGAYISRSDCDRLR